MSNVRYRKQHMSPAIRHAFRWTAFLALPGILWAAFEMFVLTMSGEQMLFFSIAHTMPPLVVAVLLAVPTGAIWLTQGLFALGWRSYRSALDLTVIAAATFVAALSLQAILLVTYEEWASSPALRFPLCILGLVSTAALVRESWRSLRPSAVAHAATPSTRDA